MPILYANYYIRVAIASCWKSSFTVFQEAIYGLVIKFINAMFTQVLTKHSSGGGR